jgi:hypothetical protein
LPSGTGGRGSGLDAVKPMVYCIFESDKDIKLEMGDVKLKQTTMMDT